MRSLVIASRRSAQSGQGLIEFGLILTIVSVCAIFLLTHLGSTVQHMFTNVSASLGGA